MLDLRPVGYIIGLLTTVLGGMMLFPLLLDYSIGQPEWQIFAEAAAISIVAGMMLTLACANSVTGGLTLRQSFVLTTGVWIVLPAFGALPFVLGAPGASWTDALFESVSGMTTTGTTAFPDLSEMTAGTHLWRAMLQWLGGLGIVIVALIFLPVMKVGGMQFFRAEGFDTLGKVLPRALDISAALVQIYVALTVTCTVVFWALGMNGFDAVIHALATMATGGFSNHDSSFTEFSIPLHYAAVVFMILATLPFIRYVQMLQGQAAPMWRDGQVRTYLRWTGYTIAIVVAWRVFVQNEPVLNTLHDSAFNVVSIFTGTGFGSGDILAWGPLPLVVLLIAGFIGGCTSSTGCSVKVFRYMVMIAAIKAQIRRILSPSAVQPVRLEGRTLDAEVINSVIVFFTLFIISFGVLAVALALTGLEARTALTAAWTAIANIGPAFGPELSANGAVDQFPTSAKWLMIIGMLLGRLELLSVYVLFTWRFWSQ